MSVIARMDKAVNDFVARCRWFHEPLTKGRARAFALQHRPHLAVGKEAVQIAADRIIGRARLDPLPGQDRRVHGRI